MSFNPALPFFENTKRCPEQVALWLEGRSWTYGDLGSIAQGISKWLTCNYSYSPTRVGILASRTIEAYAGILGTCWAGAAYVPISLKLPSPRLLEILSRTKLDALIVDRSGLKLILDSSVRDVLPRRLMLPNSSLPIPDLQGRGVKDSLIEGRPGFNDKIDPRPMSRDAIAYIIFTSGTTGSPKGVLISAGNLQHFVQALQGRYQFQSDDRVAQPSEISFDNSVLDIFNAWYAGAALYVVPEKQLLAPLRFLQEQQITVWYSVPSFAVFMHRMKLLRSGSLPAMRYSAFAGEALPASTAEAWKHATSNGIVDCLYGPTETTVVCTGDRFSDSAHITEERGIVSIGTPFPGMKAMILDSSRKQVSPGEAGELAFSGNQVATGYFEDEELTSARFPIIDGRRWYLTGDLVRQDLEGRLHHLGRIDNQIKVLGNRIELEEIEAHLRIASESEMVGVVGWPVQFGTAEKLEGFVVNPCRPVAEIIGDLKLKLPGYMVPSRIRVLAELPLNPNGKLDRRALVRFLEDESRIQREESKYSEQISESPEPGTQ